MLVIPLVSACNKVPHDVVHEVRAHWIVGCAPAPDAPPAAVTIDALGDFDPSPASQAGGLGESARSVPLSIPAATLAVTLDATLASRPIEGGAGASGATEFSGTGTADTDGNIDVSLWPTSDSCVFRAPADTDAAVPSYPSTRSGQGFGVAPDSGLVLVTGGSKGVGTQGDGASALVLDVKTGSAARVPSDLGPRNRRQGGTVTPFGSELLVAGGRDPEQLDVLRAVDVFDPSTGGFEQLSDAPLLSAPRTAHAAVVLASGETLLIGGVDENGQPLQTLEAFSPATRSYRVSGLTDLEVARAGPQAFRLSDDRILVAGGTDGTGACTLSATRDPEGACTPVELLEWLSADASRVDQESDALVDQNGGPPTAGRAFVPMPGASALVVGGCKPSVPLSDDAEECARFCPAGGCPSSDVIWIGRDGTPTPLPNALDVIAAQPILAPGDDGRPWLVADLPDGSGRVLRRFDPWLGKFVCPGSGVSGARCPSDRELVAPPDPLARAVTPDPGLLVWLGLEGGVPVLRGLRHGTGGPYTDWSAPLFGGSEGLALDRPQGADARIAPTTGSPSFSEDASVSIPLSGDVELVQAGATLAVTDATYADVSIAIDVDDGPPPTVTLGSQPFGESACPWPVPTPSAPYRAVVERRATAVLLAFSKSNRELPGLSRNCEGPAGRVPIALVGPGPVVRISAVTARRSLP